MSENWNKQQEEAEAVPVVTDEVGMEISENKEDDEESEHNSPTPDDYLAFGRALSQESQGDEEILLDPQMEKWLQLREEYHSISHNSSSSSSRDNRRLWFLDKSFEIAQDLIFKCFADYQFRFTKKNGAIMGNGVRMVHIRYVLLWWLDSCIRDCLCEQLFSGNLQNLDTAACDFARAKWEQLVTCRHHPACGDLRVHAHKHLVDNQQLCTSHETHEECLFHAIAEIQMLSDTQLLDVFESKNKQLEVILEAAITLMLFIRDDHHIQRLQHQTVAEFVDVTYTLEHESLIAKPDKKGKITYPRFNECQKTETRHLFYTSNLMRITNAYILGHGNKDRFMDITSHLVERRSYQTGGGNARQAKRRELLYAFISGRYQRCCFWAGCQRNVWCL
jgi:hypothetical protein